MYNFNFRGWCATKVLDINQKLTLFFLVKSKAYSWIIELIGQMLRQNSGAEGQ